MEKTLIIFVKEWLENYKRTTVKPATYDRLLVSYRLMEKYDISRAILGELTPLYLQKYMNELVRDGYALTTIKKQFTLLTAFLKYAYSNGFIKHPLYLSVQLPKEDNVSKHVREIEIYTEEEQRKLYSVLETLEDCTYGACILMLECGLRVGEVLSLKWTDILWNRRALRVGRTLVKLADGETFVQDSPKSRTSKRTIPMSDRAIRILEKLKNGSNSQFIFPKNSQGENPASYAQILYWLKHACLKAGVDYIGCHALRHTFASNCYSRGADVKLLSKLLGHADVSITYNIYIHLFGDELEEMRKVIV